MGTSVYKIPPLMTAIKGRVEGNDPPFSLFEKTNPQGSHSLVITPFGRACGHEGAPGGSN